MNISSLKSQLYKSISRRAFSWKERLLNILENGTGAEFLKCNKAILVDTANNLKPL